MGKSRNISTKATAESMAVNVMARALPTVVGRFWFLTTERSDITKHSFFVGNTRKTMPSGA